MQNIIIENFSSINEMLSILNTRENNSIMKYEDSSKTNGYSFTKTNSYEEAEKLITIGYTDILDEIKMRLKIEAGSNDSKPIQKNDKFGYIPNVPNSIMNLPNSMINTKRIPRKINTINLIYAPVSNCGTDKEIFIKNGIKILNIINNLEKNNIRVKLSIALFYGEKDEEITLVTVNVKNYQENLNLQKLCFPIAHPSMLRRFGFRWLETTPEITEYGWRSGYGRSLYNKEKIKHKLKNNEVFLTLNEIKEKTEEEILNDCYSR